MLKTEKLAIKLTWFDGIHPGNHRSEYWIEVFIEAGENIRDEFIVTKRCTRRRKLIGVGAHLGVVVRHRQVILLCCSQCNSRVHRSCPRLRSVEVAEETPDFRRSRAPSDMQHGLSGQRRKEIPEDSLVPDNPIRVRRVWLFDGFTVDDDINSLLRRLFSAGDEIFKLCCSKGRHYLSTP